MIERWKYQLKWGLLWGSFMAVGLTVFNAFENEDWKSFLTWNFALRMLVFNTVGIFFIGYFNWKEQEKAISKNKP